jgi:hypothetical protein
MFLRFWDSILLLSAGIDPMKSGMRFKMVIPIFVSLICYEIWQKEISYLHNLLIGRSFIRGVQI